MLSHFDVKTVDTPLKLNKILKDVYRSDQLVNGLGNQPNYHKCKLSKFLFQVFTTFFQPVLSTKKHKHFADTTKYLTGQIYGYHNGKVSYSCNLSLMIRAERNAVARDLPPLKFRFL